MMRLSTKLFLVSILFSLFAGISGGLIGTLLISKRHMPLFVIVDVQKLMRVQVSALRELQGSDKELEQAASQAAPKIVEAIQKLAAEKKIIVMNKQQVLSPLPEVTDQVVQMLEANQ